MYLLFETSPVFYVFTSWWRILISRPPRVVRCFKRRSCYFEAVPTRGPQKDMNWGVQNRLDSLCRWFAHMNILRQRRNCSPIADNIFNCIFPNYFFILTSSLKFVSGEWTINQMVKNHLLTHICITRPRALHDPPLFSKTTISKSDVLLCESCSEVMLILHLTYWYLEMKYFTRSLLVTAMKVELTYMCWTGRQWNQTSMQGTGNDYMSLRNSLYML